MKNIPLKLRVGYYILSGNNQKTYLGGMLSDYYIKAPQYVEAHGYTFAFQGVLRTDTLPEIMESLAFCTTGDNGEFVFMFNNPGLGLVAENVIAHRTQMGLEFGGIKGGA